MKRTTLLAVCALALASIVASWSFTAVRQPAAVPAPLEPAALQLARATPVVPTPPVSHATDTLVVPPETLPSMETWVHEELLAFLKAIEQTDDWQPLIAALAAQMAHRPVELVMSLLHETALEELRPS